jgi:hypothetical protein
MFCSACGKPIAASSAFCSHCGTKVPEIDLTVGNRFLAVVPTVNEEHMPILDFPAETEEHLQFGKKIGFVVRHNKKCSFPTWLNADKFTGKVDNFVDFFITRSYLFFLRSTDMSATAKALADGGAFAGALGGSVGFIVGSLAGGAAGRAFERKHGTNNPTDFKDWREMYAKGDLFWIARSAARFHDRRKKWTLGSDGAGYWGVEGRFHHISGMLDMVVIFNAMLPGAWAEVFEKGGIQRIEVIKYGNEFKALNSFEDYPYPEIPPPKWGDAHEF